jgi:hypothetical protein
MSHLVPSGDLCTQLSIISIFRQIDPLFHGRLCRWCDAIGVRIEDGWSTYDILTMLDDESVLRLGAALEKTFGEEVAKAVNQA